MNKKTVLSANRLSALADDTVIHILSFLPTKLSVSTSILSKRWRFMWAHVPNLDIDSRNHHSEIPLSGIISNIMSMPHNLHTIRLCYGFEPDYYSKREQLVVETWIASAISRNVQVLNIRFRYELPQCLFTCKTLVDLKLDCCKAIPPAQVSWPSLKKLHLCRFDCLNFDEDLPRWLCGCPVLKDLIIRCHELTILDVNRRSTISWPQTKRLIKMYFMLDGVGVDDRVKKINRYLRIEGFEKSSITISRKNSLIEANIYLCEYTHREYVYDQEKEERTPPRFRRKVPPVEFLECLSNNVKNLKLSGFYHERIFGIVDGGTTIKFDNLTKLEIGMDGTNCGFIAKLLEIADNLEVLIIYVNVIKEWIEPKQVPTCLLLHLRTIRIEQASYAQHEFCMMRYLLSKARVLERMEISPMHGKFDSEVNSDAIQRISSFERGSTACQLVFY